MVSSTIANALSLDTHVRLICRKGLYPIKDFPQILGHEASGTIVALPTDEAVLNDEQFKAREYKIGGRVVLVRIPKTT